MPLQSSSGQKSSGGANSSPLVSLLCNKCGKNLTTVSNSGGERLNVSSSSHQLTSTTTFNLSSSLTSSSNVVAANASSKDGNILTSEPSIIGCLNCAHFLPQCTVCLRIMKINLHPLPPQSRPLNFHHYLVNIHIRRCNFIKANRLVNNISPSRSRSISNRRKFTCQDAAVDSVLRKRPRQFSI